MVNLPSSFVSVAQMKEIEKKTFIESGISETVIIENVGLRAFDFFHELVIHDKIDFKQEQDWAIVLLGKGNNSADGLAMARNLHNKSYQVMVIPLMGLQKISQELKKQLDYAKMVEVPFGTIDELEKFLANQSNVIIDAVWGTGFTPPISDKMAKVFSQINRATNLVISLDIPSGICGENGKVDKFALTADYTLAVSILKTAHLFGEGAKSVGEVVIVDGGFPRKFLEVPGQHLLEIETIAHHLPLRSDWFHKNNYGHLLVIGGSEGMAGSICLAAKSALCAGCGLATAATWDENFAELYARMYPEIMLKRVSQMDDLSKYDAILIGPGLGISKQSRELVLKILSNFAGAVILDADAINVLKLSTDQKNIKMRKGLTIFTPHVGEFAHLSSIAKLEVKNNPLPLAIERARQLKAVIVLKDAHTIIAYPSGEVFVNNVRNEALSTAGSGDILAGIMASFVAQKAATGAPDLEMAAAVGVKIHSQMGALATTQFNPAAICASELINFIGDAIDECS